MATIQVVLDDALLQIADRFARQQKVNRSAGKGCRLAVRLERGEIRFYQFAAPNKSRPVLLLTRGESVKYLSKVTVAPVTSTKRSTSMTG